MDTLRSFQKHLALPFGSSQSCQVFTRVNDSLFKNLGLELLLLTKFSRFSDLIFCLQPNGVLGAQILEVSREGLEAASGDSSSYLIER